MESIATTAHAETVSRIPRLIAAYTRISLGVAFLSAVADRLGLWGPPGGPRVAWGDWSHFMAYVAVLNFFVPHWLVPALAVVATVAETGLGVLLLIGVWQRQVAALSALLLLAFALSMTLALGVKAPLDASVFAASAAAAMLFIWAGRASAARSESS